MSAPHIGPTCVQILETANYFVETFEKKGEGSGNKSMKIRLKIRSVVERLVFTYNLAKEQQLYESIESKLVIAFKHSKERLARELGVFSFNENTVS